MDAVRGRDAPILQGLRYVQIFGAPPHALQLRAGDIHVAAGLGFWPVWRLGSTAGMFSIAGTANLAAGAAFAPVTCLAVARPPEPCSRGIT